MNYYYAAKKRGLKRGKPGRPQMAAASRNGAASRIESVLKALAELIRAQESELSSLRQEGERFAAVRKLVAG